MSNGHQERRTNVVDSTAPIDIDLTAWPRRQHFEHYLNVVPCTFAITVELDVTKFVAAVRSFGRRTYVAQIWAIAYVVNRHDEFKMALTDSRRPAIWPTVHPSFTVFNASQETFASVWVPFDPDFSTFHDAATHVIAKHASATDLFPQGPPPPNAFDVSSLPWTSFTGFTINVDPEFDHLAPIFTLGRYIERDERTLLPLAIQVHHAAADGFHTARLVTELQDLLDEPTWLNA